MPSAQWVYKHARTEPLQPGMLVQMELSARLGGTFTAKGTLEVAEQFVQGDTITIRLRYIDEDRDITRPGTKIGVGIAVDAQGRERDAHTIESPGIEVSGKERFKSVYLWGHMPTDLPLGRYAVKLELDEYDRKDGQLVPAPFESRTRAVRRERLNCTYTVEPAEAVRGEARRYLELRQRQPDTQSAATQPLNESAWGEAVRGLSLKLRTDKPRYQVGERIILQFVLRNNSDAKMELFNRTVDGQSWYCQPTFEDVNGKRVPQSGGELSTDYVDKTLTLAPKEDVELCVDLGQWKLAGLGHEYTTVGNEPRTLTVTGAYRTPVGIKLQPGVWSGMVESGPLKIEIVAASRPATAQAGKEQSPAQHVWEDYRRALEFLFNGGDRAQAADRFEAVARRWTSEDDRRMADEARSVARRLRAMAEEDRQGKTVADLDKLTGQARVDYLVHELRDVAVRGVIDPGGTYVLSAIVMPPAGLPLDEARMPAVQLRRLGKEAVPSLLALLDDTRLTRSSDDLGNGSHILEYRDVAMQILEAIAGRQFLPINATGEYLSTTSQEKHDKAIADAKAWWEANKDRQEHEWLADALLENGIGWSSSSIAAAERLVELRGEKSADVFRRFVAKEPDTTWPLILLHKAGGKSVLEDVRRATKSPNLRIRATAYGILRREGVPGVVELALADLAALKEMPETKGFGNALLEFLAGCGDDRAAMAVAKLMLSTDKHVVIDARAATLQANPADKITPERLRLILPYVTATLDNQALEPGYHHMTAEWIIKAARLAIDWPQDPADYNQALQKVRLWWREHKGDYPPATRPAAQPAAAQPALGLTDDWIEERRQALETDLGPGWKITAKRKVNDAESGLGVHVFGANETILFDPPGPKGERYAMVQLYLHPLTLKEQLALTASRGSLYSHVLGETDLHRVHGGFVLPDGQDHNELLSVARRVLGVYWSQPVNGLRARIDAGAYLTKRLGMEVAVQFENVLDRPVSVDFGEVVMLPWKVLDADGKEVAPARYAPDKFAPSWYSIAPGQQVGKILGTSQNNRDGRLVIGLAEWQLKPGRYSIRCALALQSNAAGLPEGQTAWKGKLDVPAAEFEVIGEVSDDDLQKAAGVVKAAHFPTALAQWEHLAELVQPGMTVRQMLLVLPPKKMTLEEMGAGGTLWLGNFFIHRYWLDDSHAVEASGIGDASVVVSERGATQPASAPTDSATTQTTNDWAESMILTSRPRIKRLAPPATQPATAPAAGDAEWMKRHLAGFDDQLASYVKSWSAEPRLPADSKYVDKGVEELSRIIVEEGGGPWDGWESLNAFLLKTKDKPEARKALAAALLAKVDEIRATGKWSVCLYQHGQWHALLWLGDRPSVLKLMEGERLATCCGCDALMMRVVAFGQREDAWALLRHFAKDGAEGWLHHLNGCMVRLTGAKAIPAGAITDKPYDEAFRRQAIKAWEDYLVGAGIKPPQPTTAPTPSTRPAPTTQPAKATLDGQPVDGLGKSLAIQHQAARLADLIVKAKPDFTFGEGGRDMMWIEGKDTDKPSFRLGRTFIYKHAGGDVSFVLLNSTRQAGRPDDAFILVETSGPPTVAKLFDERPMHDGGSGDYAIVKSRGPAGAVLYEIGWQSEYLARWAKERRLYVLRTGDKWAFVGEGPAENFGKMGYCQQVGTTVDARVEWTQKPDAPVRILFAVTETESEWASSDMLQENPHAGDSMRDDLEKWNDWVLQGKLPATLHAVTDRPYMLARAGDTLDKVVRHLASWEFAGQDDPVKAAAVWERRLRQLNADLASGNITQGRRINLPTDSEMAELLNPSKPAPAPVGAPSTSPGPRAGSP